MICEAIGGRLVQEQAGVAEGVGRAVAAQEGTGDAEEMQVSRRYDAGGIIAQCFGRDACMCSSERHPCRPAAKGASGSKLNLSCGRSMGFQSFDLVVGSSLSKIQAMFGSRKKEWPCRSANLAAVSSSSRQSFQGGMLHETHPGGAGYGRLDHHPVS